MFPSECCRQLSVQVVVGFGVFSHSIKYARNSTPKVKQEHVSQTRHSYYHIKGECNIIEHPLQHRTFPFTFIWAFNCPKQRNECLGSMFIPV
jgi:hypothetical protein